MKITMYELLGLVKDGKAPKKIKYKTRTYYYHKGYDFDYAYTTDEAGYLQRNKSLFQFNSFKNNRWNDNAMIDFLNDEVEILEEEKKILKKIPEKIILGKRNPTHRIKKIEKKINEIIDCINSKGDE